MFLVSLTPGKYRFGKKECTELKRFEPIRGNIYHKKVKSLARKDVKFLWLQF